MKVIETKYNGFLFRSRLEARWAVFFDSLGIEWSYEPEGFEFKDGTRYLPDFYLPKFNVYVEIKPTELTPEEIHKLDCFQEESCGAIIWFVGLPGQYWGELRCWGLGGDSGGIFCTDILILEELNNNPVLVIRCDQDCFADSGFTIPIQVSAYTENSINLMIITGINRLKAINAAKSARFENGRIHEYSRQNAEPVQGW